MLGQNIISHLCLRLWRFFKHFGSFELLLNSSFRRNWKEATSFWKLSEAHSIECFGLTRESWCHFTFPLGFKLFIWGLSLLFEVSFTDFSMKSGSYQYTQWEYWSPLLTRKFMVSMFYGWISKYLWCALQFQSWNNLCRVRPLVWGAFQAIKIHRLFTSQFFQNDACYRLLVFQKTTAFTILKKQF